MLAALGGTRQTAAQGDRQVQKSRRVPTSPGRGFFLGLARASELTRFETGPVTWWVLPGDLNGLLTITNKRLLDC